MPYLWTESKVLRCDVPVALENTRDFNFLCLLARQETDWNVLADLLHNLTLFNFLATIRI